MKTHNKPTAAGSRTESAFTRCDLSVALATVILILGVVLPALANSKSRSQQAVCVNNLRLVGQGVLSYNLENYDLDPWWYVRFYAPQSSSLLNNTYYSCWLLSNGVSNPRVFACPSDASVRPAKDNSTSPGGLLNPNYRNESISYFWGLDSSALSPDSVLSGDRHFVPNVGFSSGCATGINPVAALIPGSTTKPRWGTSLHGPAGNLLLHDGRVEQTSNDTVEHSLKLVPDDGGSTHLQYPRSPTF